MFQPKDFQKLAFELSQNINSFSCGEGALSRTSISRTYYFLFLEIREIIISKLNGSNKLIFTSRKCKSKHHYIIQKLLHKIASKTNNVKIQALAEDLSDYREKRNEADYELVLNINLNNFFELTQDFNETKDFIEELRNLDKNEFYEVFSKLKDKCV